MSISDLFAPECMCLNGGRRVDEAFAAFASLHSQKPFEDEREAALSTLAFEQVRTRIQERGRWCGHFGLAENTEQFYSQEPSPPRFGGIEWEIHRFLWRPWLIQFREGRWIAKGRALDFSAERNEIPTAFFYSHVDFDMSRSAIEENIDTGTKFVMGTRFVDVLIYSREYLEYQTQLQKPLPSKGGAKLGRPIADDYVGSGAIDQLVRYVNQVPCSESEAARKLFEFLMSATAGRPPTLAEQKDRNAIDRALYFLRKNFPLLLEDCCRP
jgi:hypothetical protein